MNTTDLINQKIAERAADIVGYVRLGMTKDQAIELVRGSSTLGPKSWAAVLAAVAL